MALVSPKKIIEYVPLVKVIIPNIVYENTMENVFQIKKKVIDQF